MIVYLMVLEPLEDRYTEQWYRWFPKVLGDLGIDYEVIEGEETDHELEGEYFLDPVGTNYYKMTQMSKLIEKLDEIEENDTVFFFDLWYPGLEVLPYVKHMTDKDFNIAGVFHAGTYDPYDLTSQRGMEYFGSKLEEAWLSVIDDVFVATEFHKDLIASSRHVDDDKVNVTGLPVDILRLEQQFDTDEEQDRIAFTGRKSKEKGIDFVRQLQDEGFPIEVTLDRDMDKDEYYEFLGESKAIIAPSEQETFGYGVIEGIAAGCIPIVPDRLAFKDTVPEEYRYEDRAEAREIIELVLHTDQYSPPKDHIQQYHYIDVICRMMKHIGEIDE